MYLWLKLLHVFFVIAWFAGLFYLPRLFVNMAMVQAGSVEYQCLLLMAEKLIRFMTPLGILAFAAGMVIPFVNQWWGMGWVHTKVTLGVILLGYHGFCWKLLQDFQDGRNRYSHRWYRVFNELPVVLLAVALYLVIFKPF